MTQAELDALAAERASTNASLLAGINYTGTGTAPAGSTTATTSTRVRPGTTTVPDKNISTIPIDTRKNPETGAPAPTTPSITPPTEGGISGQLLSSLRSGILTGAQVQGGAKTFGGGATPSTARKGDAARLRIGGGTTKVDAGARAAVKRKKQTNTLGLNLGSSVGLQV